MDDGKTLDFLASLPSNTGYDKNDRYHDFRRIFTGSAEGKRVLAEILSWGHLLKSSVASFPIDPYLTHIREGERNLALRLLATVNNEPQERPAKATRRSK